MPGKERETYEAQSSPSGGSALVRELPLITKTNI